MNRGQRFSAAPVNFDRFVALNRSHSRSLSPDNELHQMLRPYQSRPTALADTSGDKHRKTAMAAPQSEDRLAGMAAVKLLDSRVHRHHRTSDLFTSGSASTTTLLETATTQAATSASRSVSSGAATSSPSNAITTHPTHSDDTSAPFYHSIEDETQELDRSLPVVEEVDLLLQAARQLGSPLYDPMKAQYLCWNLHPMEKRSRASYGDVEGVSCDFCGHTDWLDTFVTKKSKPTKGKKGGKHNEEEDEEKPTPSPHDRFLYHCPICQVDICHACLAEVRADERQHVPCLQCQRCGQCETRHNAPMHRCDKEPLVKEEEEKLPVWPLSSSSGSSSSASSHEASPPPLLSALQPAPLPPQQQPAPSKKLKGVLVGSPVRLGLSRRGTSAAVKAEVETMAMIDEEPLYVPPPREVVPAASSASRAAPTRQRAQTPRGASTTTTKRARAESVASGRESSVQMPPVPPQQRSSYDYPSDDSTPTAPSNSSPDEDTVRMRLESFILPSARYEVHLRPTSADEAEEVRRISREQRLLCVPAPAPQSTSIAYFSTRLAAETCVDRAAAASLEALLKRHTRLV